VWIRAAKGGWRGIDNDGHADYTDADLDLVKVIWTPSHQVPDTVRVPAVPTSFPDGLAASLAEYHSGMQLGMTHVLDPAAPVDLNGFLAGVGYALDCLNRDAEIRRRRENPPPDPRTTVVDDDGVIWLWLPEGERYAHTGRLISEGSYDEWTSWPDLWATRTGLRPLIPGDPIESPSPF
jgi:hypothetical protein